MIGTCFGRATDHNQHLVSRTATQWHTKLLLAHFNIMVQWAFFFNLMTQWTNTLLMLMNEILVFENVLIVHSRDVDALVVTLNNGYESDKSTSWCILLPINVNYFAKLCTPLLLCSALLFMGIEIKPNVSSILPSDLPLPCPVNCHWVSKHNRSMHRKLQ